MKEMQLTLVLWALTAIFFLHPSFFQDLFCYLFGGHIDTDTERKREGRERFIICSSPNACSSQGWTRLKAVVGSSILVLWVAEAQGVGLSSARFLGILAGS